MVGSSINFSLAQITFPSCKNNYYRKSFQTLGGTYMPEMVELPGGNVIVVGTSGGYFSLVKHNKLGDIITSKMLVDTFFTNGIGINLFWLDSKTLLLRFEGKLIKLDTALQILDANILTSISNASSLYDLAICPNGDRAILYMDNAVGLMLVLVNERMDTIRWSKVIQRRTYSDRILYEHILVNGNKILVAGAACEFYSTNYFGSVLQFDVQTGTLEKNKRYTLKLPAATNGENGSIFSKIVKYQGGYIISARFRTSATITYKDILGYVRLDTALTMTSAVSLRNIYQTTTQGSYDLLPEPNGNFYGVHGTFAVNIFSVDNNDSLIWSKRPDTWLGYPNKIIKTNDGLMSIGSLTYNNVVTNTTESYYYLLKSTSMGVIPGCTVYADNLNLLSLPFDTLNSATIVSDSATFVSKNITLGFTTFAHSPSTGCTYTSNCSSIMATGPNVICDTQLHVFTGKRNSGCSVPVNFRVFPANGVKISTLTDSTAAITFTANGQYIVFTSLLSACGTYTDSFKVHVDVLPVLTLGPDRYFCSSTPIKLSAGNWFQTYVWQNNSTDSVLTVTTPGKYYVTVQTACGTVLSDTVDILPAASIPFSAGPDRSKCDNDTIQLSATPGFLNYSWSPNYNISSTTTQGVVVSPSVDTAYIVKAEKTPGCFAFDTVKIIVHTAIPVNLGGDSTLCIGDSLVLKAGPGFSSYAWNTGETSPRLVVHTSNYYSVRAVDINSCTSNDTIQVRFDSIPVFSLGKDTSFCQTSTLLLKTNILGSYLWQNGSIANIQEATKAGIYWLKVSRGSCSFTDSIKVVIDSIPLFKFPTDTTMCNQSKLMLNAQQNDTISTYNWQDGSTGYQYLVKQPGTYVATVKKKSCQTSDTCKVVYQYTPKISLGKDTKKCMEQVLRLIAAFPDGIYRWQDNSTSATYNVVSAGTYYCTVSNHCGSIADTIKVTNEVCECDLTIPSAFSPNGDGVNDYFKPSLNCIPTYYHLSVFTRYGTVISDIYNSATPWDGLDNGHRVPVGTYFYILEVEGTFNKKRKQYSGSVTVLR